MKNALNKERLGKKANWLDARFPMKLYWNKINERMPMLDETFVFALKIVARTDNYPNCDNLVHDFRNFKCI